MFPFWFLSVFKIKIRKNYNEVIFRQGLDGYIFTLRRFSLEKLLEFVLYAALVTIREAQGLPLVTSWIDIGTVIRHK